MLLNEATEGWTAFFVKEVDGIGIYDIYNETDEWVAQVRFNRRRGSDIYVLFTRESEKGAPLKEIATRGDWRKWLYDHQGQL